MQANRVYVSRHDVIVAIMDMATAGGVISEMSGADADEVAADLRGGITFEVDGIVFAPGLVAGVAADERVTSILSPVERAPFPAGRKS